MVPQHILITDAFFTSTQHTQYAVLRVIKQVLDLLTEGIGTLLPLSLRIQVSATGKGSLQVFI